MNKVFGIHAVASLLDRASDRINKIIIDGQRRDDERMVSLLQQADIQGILIEYANKTRLEKLVGAVAHQGIIALCKERKKFSEVELDNLINENKSLPFLLILDGVQDPHNLGACLRTADAAGVQAIIAPKDNSASITAVTEKVASGAAETVAFIQVTNLVRTMRSLKEKNIWLYGLDTNTNQTLYQAKLTGSLALVLGAEGRGIRQNTLKHCDAVYAIPMAGSVASLNVSVAAGICLFEAVRQRSELKS